MIKQYLKQQYTIKIWHTLLCGAIIATLLLGSKYVTSSLTQAHIEKICFYFTLICDDFPLYMSPRDEIQTLINSN